MILRGKRAIHAEEAKALVEASALRVRAKASRGDASRSEVLDALVDDLGSLGADRMREVLELSRDLWSEPDRAMRVGQALVDEAGVAGDGTVDVGRVYARVLLAEAMEIDEVRDTVLGIISARAEELDHSRSREAMERAGWEPGQPDAELCEVTPEMIDAAWMGYRSNLSLGRVDYPDAPFYGRVWARADEVDARTGAVVPKYRYLEAIDDILVEATFHHGLPLIAANSAASVDEALLLDEALDRMAAVGLLEPTSDEPVEGLHSGMGLTMRQFDAFCGFCQAWGALGGPTDHPSDHDPDAGLDTDKLPDWGAFRGLVACYTDDESRKRVVVSNAADEGHLKAFNSLTCTRQYMELLRGGKASPAELQAVVDADRMLFCEKPRDGLPGGAYQKMVDRGLYAWNPAKGIVVYADASHKGGEYSVASGNYWIQATLPHAVTPREVMRWTLEEGFDPNEFQLIDEVQDSVALVMDEECMAADAARLAATLDAGGWEVGGTTEIVTEALVLAIRELPTEFSDSLASRAEALRHDDVREAEDAMGSREDER